ncbi:unnamed protein product [Acanthosepion pharaonis]|uniref:Uncharacterized protein n=1 Tax=Acanthosepion pharaonis TaxID=158019 RepID=A0A812EGR7_ACAPH|nr:unnamed protein product [Sepia pharaonis]
MPAFHLSLHYSFSFFSPLSLFPLHSFFSLLSFHLSLFPPLSLSTSLFSHLSFHHSLSPYLSLSTSLALFPHPCLFSFLSFHLDFVKVGTPNKAKYALSLSLSLSLLPSRSHFLSSPYLSLFTLTLLQIGTCSQILNLVPVSFPNCTFSLSLSLGTLRPLPSTLCLLSFHFYSYRLTLTRLLSLSIYIYIWLSTKGRHFYRK